MKGIGGITAPRFAPLAYVASAAFLLGCNGGNANGLKNESVRSATPVVDSRPSPSEAPATITGIAPTKRPAFDGEKAYAILKKQCEFGPRPVGSEAHRKTRDFLMDEMRKYADKTVAQDFLYRGLPLTNIIGVFNPEQKKQVLLCAHWDTRPRADQEIDEAKQNQPILGANDGASGVAILIEIARMFKEQKPNVGVVIVLLDGEDYGSFEKDEGVLLGAKHFAKNHRDYNIEYGILLDMVGDKNLDIYREQNSQRYAPGTNEKFFRAARELGHGKFIIDDVKTNVTDDHIPLNVSGIRTIDIIDFNYAPWHTLDDTPDKCSAESLMRVGDTTAEVVYRER